MFKRIMISALAFAGLASMQAAAFYPSPDIDSSDVSLMVTASVAVSAVSIAFPAVFVVGTVTVSIVEGQTKVAAMADNGETVEIVMPAELAADANLQAGDELTLTETATGMLVHKDGKPLVYAVAPSNADLSRNRELTPPEAWSGVPLPAGQATNHE